MTATVPLPNRIRAAAKISAGGAGSPYNQPYTVSYPTSSTNYYNGYVLLRYYIDARQTRAAQSEYAPTVPWKQVLRLPFHGNKDC